MGPVPDVLRAIISHMSDGVIYLDSQHVIQLCNPAAETIRQVNAERIVGRSIFDIHPRRAHPQISELLANLQSGTLPTSHRIVQAQGRCFENIYSAVMDVHGDFLGTLLISRDITEQRRLSHEIDHLKHAMTAKESCPPLVFSSPMMERLLSTLEVVAPLDSTVLISGESGTGKECILDLLHSLSPRSEQPLVKVNCGALPENLVESELFGHTRGAFTGAHTDNKGKFVSAAGGTLFLDEIGELPLAAQVKLLRVIQDKIVQPVGGRHEINVDVRIVAATNSNLAEAVAAGRFREDLFYRLNVISLEVPPLRERHEDIIPLAEAFLKHFADKMKKPLRQLSAPARDLLLRHSLPGNVRQLKHAMERAVALGQGEMVLPADLPADLRDRPSLATSGYSLGTNTLKEALGGIERELIQQALVNNAGKKIPTAKDLSISRKTLWEKMQRYNLASNVTF